MDTAGIEEIQIINDNFSPTSFGLVLEPFGGDDGEGMVPDGGQRARDGQFGFVDLERVVAVKRYGTRKRCTK